MTVHHVLVHVAREHLLHAVLEEHVLSIHSVTALLLELETAHAVVWTRLHVWLLEKLLPVYAHLDARVVLQVVDVAQHIVDDVREVEHALRLRRIHAKVSAAHLLSLLLAPRLLLLLI